MRDDHLRQRAPRLVAGLTLAVFGALLLGDNLGLVDAGPILPWFWSAALLLFGLASLAAGRRWLVLGLLAFGLGGVVLARAAGYPIDLDLPELVFPMLLLIVGGHLVRRALGGAAPPPAPGEESGATVESFAFLAGNELRSASRSFRGGALSAFMGGCNLDLREARTPPEGARIDAFALWGGVEIRVPEGWQVDGRVVPLLGAFEDKSRPAPGGTPTGSLTVTGWAIMGGVEVKN